MDKNQGIQEYLSYLSATLETNYTLWKATKRLKRPQIHNSPIGKQNRSLDRSEEKEKGDTFIEYLFKFSKPNPRKIT